MSLSSTGFAPVCSPSARVLILGSMPGQASLQQQQYYAHPRNAFWPILSELLGFDAGLDYRDRLDLVGRRRIALWDVLAECVRPGSLDSAIRRETIRVNDFSAFLGHCPDISRIVFNGQTAARFWALHVLPGLSPSLANIECRVLPSTSPAHAACSRAQKLEAWRAALCDLTGRA
ncbi:MAG: DNA-deoxyinosine glycosylase [Xanthomonadaceae bacterium]|nr:DNA-deoxyinosine glycosylase [Xanthomonadaceae bacterium]